MKKPAKIGLWLLGLAVLGLLALWLEHERAKARLAAFKADLIAKGEKLAIADHVPKLPPALSNAAPEFIAAANRLTELKLEWQPQRMRLVAPGRARVTWQQAELPTDKEPDLWPFIIAHVEDNRPLLAEMAAALERPEMVFNLDYTKGFSLVLPHLSKMRSAASAFANAATVDLRSVQPDSAFTNLMALVQLSPAFQERLLISMMVRVSLGHYAMGGTWEALQYTNWTPTQLAALQAAWQNPRWTADWAAAVDMERAIASDVFAKCRGIFNYYDELGTGPSGPSRSFWLELWDDPHEAGKRMVKRGKFLAWMFWHSYADEQWAIEQSQLGVDTIRRCLRENTYAASKRHYDAEIKRRGEPNEMFLLSGLILGPCDQYLQKLAFFETVRRLTFTAIALHRHKLKHGQFPDSLAALVPEFLAEVPRDFMDGQPLRYRFHLDDQFLLWSVGEDFKDDGGNPTPATPPGVNEALQWLRGRDWVWPQPATEAEVAAYHAELAAKRAPPAPKPPP